MPFAATVLTMFPEAFPGSLGVSLIGTAWREMDLWRLETVDIRAFSKDKRGFLDDTPAGGGPGQVMRADVIAAALDSVDVAGRPLLYMSARGRPLTQARVQEWAGKPGIIVLCGRFEGVDQRVLDAGGSRRSPSATRSWPVARRRRWWRSRLACVWSRVFWANRTASVTKASRTASSSIRSSRDRGRSKGSTSPRCCSAAITRRSRPGGGR